VVSVLEKKRQDVRGVEIEVGASHLRVSALLRPSKSTTPSRVWASSLSPWLAPSSFPRRSTRSVRGVLGLQCVVTDELRCHRVRAASARGGATRQYERFRAARKMRQLHVNCDDMLRC
jgi:hypothetical protein